MTRSVVATVDLSALSHNLARVREVAPNSRVMAVIKANAYGHGIVRIAQALHGIDAFGVACLEEALTLRGADIKTPIVLLEGVNDTDELALASTYRLELVVHHPAQVSMLERATLPMPVKIWLKVDTGMHRLGFVPEATPKAWTRLRACAAVDGTPRLLSHLANADDRRDRLTLDQCETFLGICEGLGGEASLANSGGLLGWPQAQLDWVRPGIMLYGVSPFVGRKGEQEGLRPVMTLSTRLIAVNHYKKGDAIGYGGAWVCPQDMPVGVAAIGYGDGYPRQAEPGTPVLVNGRRVPLVGRVSMDMICVDLRTQPQAQAGDPVHLWGNGLPVEEVADHASTIAYELLCRVTQRVSVQTVSHGIPEPALDRRIHA